MKLYSIGEVSKIKGITIKTLRYYQSVALIEPAYVDENSGYRYYSAEQFIQIDIIKGCRKLGVSIKELQEILKTKDTEKLISFLKEKKLEAERNIESLKNTIEEIDNLNSQIEFSKKVVKETEIKVKYFKERWIIKMVCEELGDYKELLYYSKLENLIIEKNIENTDGGGMMYLYDDKGNLEKSYAFKFIEPIKEEYKDIIGVEKLPEGNYITLSYSKENENEQIKKFDNYLENNNLNLESLIEIDLLNDIFNTKSYNCQIQMKIK
ncbi:MerR family transcriptional regulator [Clostridium perfringens]|nr:MerR family transcriptional regulator [Clostridium perfringens]